MRTALLLSIPYDPKIEEEVRLGRQPLPDYLALAQRLDATLLTPIRYGRQPTTGLGKALGFVRTAWAGFRVRHRYDAIISDIDRVGLILALLLKLTRSRTRHVVICHSKMMHPLDSNVVRLLRLYTHIHRLVCYGPEAAELVARKIPALADRIVVVRHGQDHRFWQAQGAQERQIVVSAGLFRRDFDTLIEAVDGLSATVEVAAHSPWVTGGAAQPRSLPSNVTFRRHDYEGLRTLYDQALVVAVPLMPTHSQAGSLVVYEAMAMGKPVIVTRTEGQASLRLVEEGVTGYYVEPHDVARWRELIQRFLDDPGAAREMGRRARERVEAALNLEAYAEEMARVVCDVPETVPSAIEVQAATASDGAPTLAPKP